MELVTFQNAQFKEEKKVSVCLGGGGGGGGVGLGDRENERMFPQQRTEPESQAW